MPLAFIVNKNLSFKQVKQANSWKSKQQLIIDHNTRLFYRVLSGKYGFYSVQPTKYKNIYEK